MDKLIKKLKCYFGFHEWVNIDKTPMPKLEAGQIYCYSDLHECKHCKKQQYLGMGCIV